MTTREDRQHDHPKTHSERLRAAIKDFYLHGTPLGDVLEKLAADLEADEQMF